MCPANRCPPMLNRTPNPTPRAPKAVAPDTALVFAPDEAAQRAPIALAVDDLTPPPPPPKAKRGIRWSRILFGALGALLSLAHRAVDRRA